MFQDVDCGDVQWRTKMFLFLGTEKHSNFKDILRIRTELSDVTFGLIYVE